MVTVLEYGIKTVKQQGIIREKRYNNLITVPNTFLKASNEQQRNNLLANYF